MCGSRGEGAPGQNRIGVGTPRRASTLGRPQQATEGACCALMQPRRGERAFDVNGNRYDLNGFLDRPDRQGTRQTPEVLRLDQHGGADRCNQVMVSYEAWASLIAVAAGGLVIAYSVIF